MRISAILIFIICCAFFPAGAKADLSCFFEPVDSVTRLNLKNTEVLVFLPGDSTVVAEGRELSIHTSGELIARKGISFSLPENVADYNVYVNADGYMPRMIPLKITKEHRPGMLIHMGEIGLMRMPKQLDEVTVTATKIRMYYKGDTVIYNADAFLLPEGSMLDDLIRKLDGVTINRAGEIFHYGRKIESLQLEGRRLFDGSPKTLLENLGAYTVNKIKVYEQADEISEFLGYSESKEKPLVMDVNLKKEYSIGKWVNLDAGYGTSDRYLARGFFLGFTNTLALSGYVNINNLGESSTPDQYESWNLEKTKNSESRYLSGGLSYQYNTSDRKKKVVGSVSANSSDITRRAGSETINYLPSGDTYESRYNRTKSRSFSFSTNHTYTEQTKLLWYSLTPKFDCLNINSDGNNTAATFDEDPGRVTAEEIEAIYSHNEEKLCSLLINRQLSKNKRNYRDLRGSLASSFIVKLPDFNDIKHNLNFNASGNYNYSKSNYFNDFAINYGAETVPAQREYAYTRSGPNKSGNLNLLAGYTLNIGGAATLGVNYNYSFSDDRSSDMRYLLNELDSLTLGKLSFAQIPPLQLLDDVIDRDNSHRQKYRGDEHVVNFTARYSSGQRSLDKPGAKGFVYFYVNPKLKILNRRLNYSMIDYDTVAARRFVVPEVNARLNYAADTHEQTHDYFTSLSWESIPQLFSMNNLIDVANTTDPLNIYRGNPDLHSGYRHNASAEFTYTKRKNKYMRHGISFRYSIYTGSIVSGTIYDPVTGVRTTSMYNVDGERGIRVSYNGSGDIVKWENKPFKSISYNASLTAESGRWARMIATSANPGADNIVLPETTFTYSKSLNPSAGLTVRFGSGHNIGISGSGFFNHYHGEDFDEFSAADYNFGINGSFSLPRNIRLSTSLKVVGHSGYADSVMNSEEYLWNISASWSLNRKLSFSLDGYDLLHQIKSVSYYVSSSGRTEQWNNTIGRYVMLRLHYRLDLTKL